MMIFIISVSVFLIMKCGTIFHLLYVHTLSAACAIMVSVPGFVHEP